MKITIAALLASVATVVAEGNAPAITSPLGKCVMNMDCDNDYECAGGLLCADDHKSELQAAGFNTRTADCGMETENPLWEVCFDPCILAGSCPSGGGMGDPHFQTFDGTQYSFHGECDLVMARSPAFDSGLGLDIHVRTTMVDDWSLISHAAIRIGDDVFEVVNDRFHVFNGVKDVELPLTIGGKYTLTKGEKLVEYGSGETAVSDQVLEYTIDLGKGLIKVTNFKRMLTVNVEAYLPGTEGMLGVQGTIGMISRDGAMLDDANEMGKQWQVRSTEAMLFSESRAPQYPETCRLPAVNSRRLRRSDVEVKMAEQACESVVTSLRQFCMEDVLRSGDATMAMGYKSAGNAIAF